MLPSRPGAGGCTWSSAHPHGCCQHSGQWLDLLRSHSFHWQNKACGGMGLQAISSPHKPSVHSTAMKQGNTQALADQGAPSRDLTSDLRIAALPDHPTQALTLLAGKLKSFPQKALSSDQPMHARMGGTHLPYRINQKSSASKTEHTLPSHKKNLFESPERG